VLFRGQGAGDADEMHPRRAGYVVWLAWLGVMAGTNLATPLYPVYAARWHFSELTLTLIFATYAAVLVPTLVVFGRLSDHVGRRPVLLAGLGAAAGGLALFAAASSIGWLFAARVLQGLAVGMISGAATSALVEYDDNRSQRPAMLAGLAQAAGSGLGPLAAGVLAQWAPAPGTLSYLVWLAGTLVAVVIVARLPEPAPDLREPWRVQWPRIPPEIRRDFSRVSLSAACVWASIALYLSIVPSYTGKLLHNHNLALYGVIAALALASSSVAQLIGRRCAITSRRRAQGFGLATLAAGLVLLVMAAPVHSVAALLVSAATTGAGHGPRP
jgi:MFS family permease